MTPMERACLEFGSCDDPVDMKLCRATIAAYLEAIATDEATVERVARAIAWEGTELRYKIEWGPKEQFPVSDDQRDVARAALLSLTNSDTRKVGT